MFLSSLLWLCAAYADTTILFPQNVQNVIESTIHDDFVGIVQIVQNETILYSFAKGETVSGGLINAQSLVPISSLVSPLIALAITEGLAKENTSLDIPLQHYFPSLSDVALSKDGQFCTVRLLLSHRCGIPTYLPGQQGQEDRFLSSVNYVRLKEKPGTTHRYSLAGEELSMMLLHRLYREGSTKDDILRTYIKDCAVYDEIRVEQKPQQMQSVFYTPFGFGASSSWFHIPHDSYLSVRNHMVASAHGLNCWLATARKQGLLEQLRPPENESYGLGIAWEQQSYGSVYWHTAQLPLQMSSFWAIVPESGLQIVILSPQSNAPYSVSQLGHMIVDELHNKEYDKKFYSKEFGGQLQASLSALFPIFAAFAPMLAAFILLFRPPIARIPFALRIQFCFFSSLFVRQATPFASIPIGEWATLLLVMILILAKGLQDRKQEPLFSPHQNFGMIVEYIIYGVLMMTWLPRASNTIPLYMCFALMVVMVGVIRGTEQNSEEE